MRTSLSQILRLYVLEVLSHLLLLSTRIYVFGFTILLLAGRKPVTDPPAPPLLVVTCPRYISSQ